LKYSTGYNGKYDILSKRAEKNRDNAVLLYNLTPKICLQCNSNIPYDLRNNKFCNHSCSATYNNLLKLPRSIKSRAKTSESLSGKTYTIIKNVTCCVCNTNFNLAVGTKRNLSKIKCKTCYRPCRPKRIIDLSKLKDYRLACKFKFSLKDFPNELEFTLIEQYGWYSASNHGNNLSGVSRDHMVSVRYGFDNNIDPKILAHPANCKLMQHSSNISKYVKNSITYEELLVKIKEWDIKYPPGYREDTLR
jgi:hypothetical protein